MDSKEDRRGYAELKEMINDLYNHINNSEEKILKKFDDHKLLICDPTRLEFTKKIAKLEVKSGLFGFIGGAIILLINLFIKKI